MLSNHYGLDKKHRPTYSKRGRKGYEQLCSNAPTSHAERQENKVCYQSVLRGRKFSQITLEISEQCPGFFLKLRWNWPFFSSYVGNHSDCYERPLHYTRREFIGNL